MKTLTNLLIKIIIIIITSAIITYIAYGGLPQILIDTAEMLLIALGFYTLTMVMVLIKSPVKDFNRKKKINK